MSEGPPIFYLARHGDTAWAIKGQHTGLTNLPLTERGERNARRLAERLRGLTFAKVFTSPMQRAARTTFILFSSFVCLSEHENQAALRYTERITKYRTQLYDIQ
jgi:probable phosphoglycerate mutase